MVFVSRRPQSLCWADLPPQVQRACAALGCDGDVWDAGLQCAAGKFGWEELGEREREAAALVGYNEESWCETEAPVAAAVEVPLLPTAADLAPQPAPVPGPAAVPASVSAGTTAKPTIRRPVHDGPAAPQTANATAAVAPDEVPAVMV